MPKLLPFSSDRPINVFPDFYRTVGVHILPSLIICVSIYFISINFVDIPTGDQFDELAIIKAYYENTLTFKQFLKCQNENPVVYYRLISIPLALMSHWNLWIEELLLFCTIIGTYFTLIRISSSLKLSFWNQVVINIFFASLLFSLGQYGNFINAGGVYLHIYIAVLSFLLFSSLLFSKPLTTKRLILSIVFGHICSWSYAPGMLIWVLAGVILGVTEKRKIALVFLGLFALHFLLYFYLLSGYTEGVAQKLLDIQSWKNIGVFIPYYLSASMFPQMERGKLVAYLFGLVSILVLLYLAVRVIFNSKSKTPPIFSFSLILISYTVIIGTLIALGRFNGEITLDTIFLTSRYLIHTNLAIFGVVLLCFNVANHKKRQSFVVRGVVIVLALMINMKSFLIYKHSMASGVKILNACKVTFCSGLHNDQLMLNNVSPFADIYENGREAMIKYKLNCFSDKNKNFMLNQDHSSNKSL